VKRRLRQKTNNTVVDLVTTRLQELSSNSSGMSEIFKDFIAVAKEKKHGR